MTTPCKKQPSGRDAKQCEFDPFVWFKHLLKCGSDADAVLLELNRFVAARFKDRWRGCWRAMVCKFEAHAYIRSTIRFSKKHPRGLITSQLMKTYTPESLKIWWGSIDDASAKRRIPDYAKYRVNNYQLTNDLFGWALDCTLKYCRYRMRKDVPTRFFYVWPKSQRACRHLVHLLFNFAEARRQYDLRIAARIIHRWHLVERTKKKTVRLIIGNKKVGRPRPIFAEPKADEDLWLILIWPIAVRRHWTYQDVVRAVRLHFSRDALGNPPPAMNLQQMGKAIVAYYQSRISGQGKDYVPNAEEVWRTKTLRVSLGDKRAMLLRCRRLGLPRLPERSRKQPDIEREPPFVTLTHSFLATT